MMTEAMTDNGKPSLDLCAKMANKVKTDLESVSGDTSNGEAVNKTKVTMEDLVTNYNLELVTGEGIDECTLRS